jgi:hypothetical protein
MDYASYAMLSCGITYLAVAISLVFILDKVGRRSLFLCKKFRKKNLLKILNTQFLDGLIGMAAATCVIGVTILKSKNVSFGISRK